MKMKYNCFNNLFELRRIYILCTINLAIVLYGYAHPRLISISYAVMKIQEPIIWQEFALKIIQNYQTQRPC